MRRERLLKRWGVKRWQRQSRHHLLSKRTAAKWARWAVMWLLPMLLLPLAGCDDQESLGRVRGTITMDGKPLEQAVVQFTPLSASGSTSYGRTDDIGSFTMEFSRSQTGASLGANRVEIRTGNEIAAGDGDILAIPERVPARYNAESELTFDVHPGDNEANFELESDGQVVPMRDPEG